MDARDPQTPRARQDRLVVQDLPDEVLVYDLDHDRAHSLNRTAAWVWRHCDGKTTVDDLAALMHRELGLPLDEELVWLALSRLGTARLLEKRLTMPSRARGASRRAAIRTLAMAGGLALVTTIVAPKAHAIGTHCSAQNPCRPGNGKCCSVTSTCISPCTTNGMNPSCPGGTCT